MIGAGVVGCAIARELARYRLSVSLLDGEDDVACATSKANTAILHTGFDATPGTLESRLVRRGYDLLGGYAEEVGIPVERTGALLVAWDGEQLAALPALADKARANGYDACETLTTGQLYDREPHLGPGAMGALAVPGEAIICPWTTPLAFVTQAVLAGVELRLSTRVTGVTRTPDGHRLALATGEVLDARFVVNAAGLFSDAVDGWVRGPDRPEAFTVTPRRGQLVVYDKLSRDLVRHILLPVPTKLGKGVLVAPTVFGNVMLGPTAEDLDDRTATGSTADGLDFLLGHARRILPALLDEEVTAVYAGLRAATEHADYQLRGYAEHAYVCVGGIRSTGLTASMAIAEEVAGLLADAGLGLVEPQPLPSVRMPQLGEASTRPYQDGDLIARDGEYGAVVCHCERVTRGELRDAFTSPVPPRSLEGLRRRTRVMMGRCQGFYCGSAVRGMSESLPVKGFAR